MEPVASALNIDRRDLVTLARAAAELLVGGVRCDAVDPGSEGRITSEGIDLLDHAAESVLHGLLGILSITRDTHRQPIPTIAVASNETLRRRPIAW